MGLKDVVPALCGIGWEVRVVTLAISCVLARKIGIADVQKITAAGVLRHLIRNILAAKCTNYGGVAKRELANEVGWVAGRNPAGVVKRTASLRV